MSSHKKIERGAVLFSLALVILGALLVNRMATQARAEDEKEGFWDFTNVFNEVFHTIQEDYVDDVDPEILYRGALNGMFFALDDHSAFMGSDSFDQLEKETEGEFSGVGIHIVLRDGILTVVAPIPGGPAAKLGIQPWDRIIKIEGESTEGITLIEAVRKLTGPRGTQVNMTIWRPGLTMEGEDLTVTRDIIKIESVFAQIIDDEVGYIRLSKFSDKVARQIKREIAEMREEGVRGIILDLRFNSGGLLGEAIMVSDLFLPKGATIVSTRGRDDEELDSYAAEEDAATDLPVMILVNRGSASASEIVTAALSDHDRALVIGPEGETTFGKGSVQTIKPLNHSFEKDDNGNYRFGAVKITTAHYFTPDGTKIHGVGITPDVEIEIPDGHNRELLTRGMLGDPDMRGPDDEESTDEANPEEEEELPLGTIIDIIDEESSDESSEPEANGPETDGVEEEAESGEGTETFFLKDTSTSGNAPDGESLEDAEEEEEFHDIMLDEAVRLMKAYLILGGKIKDVEKAA